ncbi:MAG TPA: phosphate ABC transporter permease PstA [Dehalococcoidia bacterium]|jgi:phosphate transport system permease protein|nr:phosphate ABC transporter permease PstA [Dehalococcoidia bacterium]
MTAPAPSLQASVQLRIRKLKGLLFLGLCLAAVAIALAALATLVVDVVRDGLPRLSWDFINSYPSRFPERAGIKAALYGSAWMIVITVAVALPVGVCAAIYLEEYASKNWFSTLLEINISNLAGVPSIIYGLLGLQLFVRAMDLGRSVLAGGLTMALLVLPIIIIASREAIRAVPSSMRDAAYALGATKWQTVRRAVLPYAFSGIMTGNILATSRAMGETAPLITIGALTFVPFVPDSPLSPFTVLPIQIFNWVSRPQAGFHTNAAAGIVVLMIMTLGLNLAAILLRNRFQQRW